MTNSSLPHPRPNLDSNTLEEIISRLIATGIGWERGESFGNKNLIELRSNEAKAALLSWANKRTAIELESLSKIMDECPDCPKDEPPSLHLLFRINELTGGVDETN